MERKEYIYNKLNEMNVDYFVINHNAIFSEKETNFDDFDDDIMLGKNLFLRNDKKSTYYLVCLPLMKRANLSALAKLLNEKKLTFANEDDLNKYLSITPGSVSYLNVITAKASNDLYKEIIYIIDRELLEAKKIGFHPSDNTATVVTRPDIMIKIYDEYGLNYMILDL